MMRVMNRARGERKKQPTDWGPVAGWYDALVGEEGSEYQREVVIPGGIADAGSGRGEGKREGLKVLDLACGQGVLCRKLAAAGCRVTGVDAAEALIAAAKEREARDGLGIRYVVADVTRLADEEGKLGAGLEAGVFDAVTIVLAVQNMTPLSPVWRACRAALKPGGKLVIVMMHPAFRIPRRSDWLWEPSVEGGTQSRIIRRYLSSESIEIQTHPGLAAHGKNATTTTHFHRPLQAYINTLGNAGLLIDHIEEWTSHKFSEAGPRKAALDRSRKEIPMFLAIRREG